MAKKPRRRLKKDAYQQALQALAKLKSEKASRLHPAQEPTPSGTEDRVRQEALPDVTEPDLRPLLKEETTPLETRLEKRLALETRESRSELRDLLADHKTEIQKWLIGVLVGAIAIFLSIVFWFSSSVKGDMRDVSTDVRGELRTNIDRLDRAAEGREARIRALEAASDSVPR